LPEQGPGLGGDPKIVLETGNMLLTADQLKSKLETLAPGTQAEVTDLTGTRDHWQATIISPVFEGKMMIEQHRLVMKLMQADIDSGVVHALTIKTFAPSQVGNSRNKA
jgi:stress-induced morphogen